MANYEDISNASMPSLVDPEFHNSEQQFRDVVDGITRDRANNQRAKTGRISSDGGGANNRETAVLLFVVLGSVIVLSVVITGVLKIAKALTKN